MTSNKGLGFPDPDDLSPSEEWAYAQEMERDSRKDDWRVVGYRIDLEEPTDQGADDEWAAELRRSVRMAQDRIGRSDEERVRWFLRFASLNEANLLEEDWRSLQSEVLAFTVSPSAHSILCEVGLADRNVRFVKVDVLELHRWAKSGLSALGEPDRPAVWTIDARISRHFTWSNRRLVGEPPADGDLADGELTSERFKAQVGNILTSQGHRVRLCENCAQPFLGRKRQAYCSVKCSQARRTRRYREKYPERIRQQRHEAHVRKQQRRHGPKVKVTRRQRKAKP